MCAGNDKCVSNSPITRAEFKNDSESGKMNNVSPGKDATDGSEEAHDTAAKAPTPKSSPPGQPLKNGIQRHQARSSI